MEGWEEVPFHLSILPFCHHMSRPFPIVLLGFICLSILCVFELPESLWGLILKGFFVVFIVVLLKAAVNRMILPGTLISAVFFTLAWWSAPAWPMYLFGILMFGVLVMTYKTVETYFGGFGKSAPPPDAEAPD